MTRDPFKEKFLKVAIRAAGASGKIQMKGLGKTHRIHFKGEINIVTEIDKACEETIQRIISREFPDHDFLMEESGFVSASGGRSPSSGGITPRWIIDPLDGTTNYAHGYPLFCTSIALEYRGQVILGVVYEPNRNQLFVGVKGGGATLDGRRIQVSRTSRLKRAMLATGFAYNVQTKTDNNLNHFRNFIMGCQAVRRDGVAAVDLCYLAAGRYDGFWELDLWPWDTAAAALILQEAGGRVTLFDGSPFDIYKKEIVASNGILHPSMLKVIRKGRKNAQRRR